MEMVDYRCPICGFIYQVPAYWSSFDPDEVVNLEHINVKTGEMCMDKNLQKVQGE